MTGCVCATIAELDIPLKIKKTFYRKRENSIFQGQNLECISNPGEQGSPGVYDWDYIESLVI